MLPIGDRVLSRCVPREKDVMHIINYRAITHITVVADWPWANLDQANLTWRSNRLAVLAGEHRLDQASRVKPRS